uniref:Metalloendopeptidase n=1 Tax=Culicoides sonorensis TaxID=179676 RepID=A0A336N719_CULSO
MKMCLLLIFLDDSIEWTEDPEVTPGLYQGDIAIDSTMHQYLRVGLKWDTFQNRMWSNRQIPYVVSPLYNAEEQVVIMMAIRTINFLTCVKFVEWNRNETDFLLIWPIKHPKGCWSYIGKTGGPQIVSLQPPDHKSYKSNFEKQSLKNTSYSFEYDFNSIMHYGKYYFSKEKGKPTLTPKIPNYHIGQRKQLSVTDCLKINDLYGCLEEKTQRNKYYNRCKTFGL